MNLKGFQENMASMLWGDLDMTALQKGAEDFERDAKKFPKELKEIYTFKMVEGKILNFKDLINQINLLKCAKCQSEAKPSMALHCIMGANTSLFGNVVSRIL
jgi:hypothetical protein